MGTVGKDTQTLANIHTRKGRKLNRLLTQDLEGRREQQKPNND